MPTITPIPAPTQGFANATQSPPGTSARDRAISKLMEGAPTNQGQPNPVQNPTRVSPEELSAVQAPTQQRGGQSSDNEPAAASEETKAAPSVKDEPVLSSQYAVLARKEKAFRQKVASEQAALKSEREALERQKAEYAAKDVEYQSKYIPKERLTEDTINVLLENGLTYDQITQMMLSQGSAHQDPVIKAQIAELKAANKAVKDAIEENKRLAQEAQNQQYQEALKQIHREATSLVNSDPNFEAIRETGSVKDVVELIEKTYKEDGIMLSVDEAATEVEEYLIGQLSKYAQRIKKLQGSKTNTQQKAAPAQVATQTGNSQEKSPAKTLTNSMGTSRQLTRRERAILAFEGKLKQ